MKITYRDKIFLTVVVALLTLVLGYMVIIKPSSEDLKSSKASLESAQNEKEEIDAKIAKIPGVKKQITTLVEESKEKENVFLKPTPTHRADVFVQKLLDKNGIVFSELEISDMKTLDLAPYVYYPEVFSFEMKPSDSEDNTVTETPEEIVPQMLPAYTIKISYRAYQDGLEKFLTDTNSMKDMSVVISELTWGTEADMTKLLDYDEDTQTGTYAPLAEGLISGEMNITVYYVNPISNVIGE